ncbi:hypothetical protein GPECTOR_45g137 [Gonium pectorale]|uniref:WSC domain-containing protein n=1 Tax=Gonium pectorale TaxID=33097 RepID=A0A150G8U7_GONPE|nr:hypothetical protein GPECTOR_45g137 [Gonium pectorale]|eukprot:KXZ46267.1 hypothetical protein GPECTOR_45g137 [Gonium pectorale]
MQSPSAGGSNGGTADQPPPAAPPAGDSPPPDDGHGDDRTTAGSSSYETVPVSSTGAFLHLDAVYGLQSCDAATKASVRTLRIEVHECDTFSAVTTPAYASACVDSNGCSRNVSACNNRCYAGVLQMLQATFNLDDYGLVSNLTLQAVPSAAPAGGMQQLAGALGGTVESFPADLALLLEGCEMGSALSTDIQRRIFDILAQQAHIRMDEVSEELPVEVGPSSNAGAETEESADDEEDGPLRTDLYVLNAETHLAAPAADGSRLVTTSKYMVPTDQAYEEMNGSPYGIPAGKGTERGWLGGVAHTLVSASGRVVARVDMMMTELVIPVRDPTAAGENGAEDSSAGGSGDASGGTGGSDSSSSEGGDGGEGDGGGAAGYKEAAVLRTRCLLTLTLPPPPPSPPPPQPPKNKKSARSASVSATIQGRSGGQSSFDPYAYDEGVATAGAGASAEAVLALTSLLPQLATTPVDALYPGGFITAQERHVRRLAENSLLRRRRRAMELLQRAATASGGAATGVGSMLVGPDGAALTLGDLPPLTHGRVAARQLQGDPELFYGKSYPDPRFKDFYGVYVLSRKLGARVDVGGGYFVERSPDRRNATYGYGVSFNMDLVFFDIGIDNAVTLVISQTQGISRNYVNGDYNYGPLNTNLKVGLFGQVWSGTVPLFDKTVNKDSCDAFKGGDMAGWQLIFSYSLEANKTTKRVSLDSLKLKYGVFTLQFWTAPTLQLYRTGGRCGYNNLRMAAMGLGVGLAWDVGAAIGVDLFGFISARFGVAVSIVNPKYTAVSTLSNEMFLYGDSWQPTCRTKDLNLWGLGVRIFIEVKRSSPLTGGSVYLPRPRLVVSWPPEGTGGAAVTTSPPPSQSSSSGLAGDPYDTTWVDGDAGDPLWITAKYGGTRPERTPVFNRAGNSLEWPVVYDLPANSTYYVCAYMEDNLDYINFWRKVGLPVYYVTVTAMLNGWPVYSRTAVWENLTYAYNREVPVPELHLVVTWRPNNWNSTSGGSCTSSPDGLDGPYLRDCCTAHYGKNALNAPTGAVFSDNGRTLTWPRSGSPPTHGTYYVCVYIGDEDWSRWTINASTWGSNPLPHYFATLKAFESGVEVATRQGSWPLFQSLRLLATGLSPNDVPFCYPSEDFSRYVSRNDIPAGAQNAALGKGTGSPFILDVDITVTWRAGSALYTVGPDLNGTRSTTARGGTWSGDNVLLGDNAESVFWPAGGSSLPGGATTTTATPPDTAEYHVCVTANFDLGPVLNLSLIATERDVPRPPQDLCSAGPCGPASCTNAAGGSWACGPCPDYMVAGTTSLNGVSGPTCKGYDAGYYLGCFAAAAAAGGAGGSGSGMSPLQAAPLLATRADMTPALCASLARAAGTYTLYGVAYGSQCYGVTDLRLAASQGPSSACTAPCGGNASRTCGGSAAFDLYSLSPALGCFADNATRLLPDRLEDGLSLALCGKRARDAGFTLYGMQYGSQCFAGSDLRLATSLGPSTCGVRCADGIQTCGGSWASSIFATADATDVEAPNLALDQPAYASSVFDGVLGPEYAFDGETQYVGAYNEGGRPHIAHTVSSDGGSWLSVDLGAPAAVARLVIWNRCDCCAERLQGAELRVGNVSVTNAAGSIAGNALVWTQGAPLGACAAEVVVLRRPVVGRWVTLQNRNPAAGGVLHITELQVFGVYAAADLTTGVLCEGAAQPSRLQCPSGNVIAAVSPFYGRSDTTTCPYPGGPGAVQNTRCASAEFAAQVRTACLGQSACSVNYYAVPDPCDGTYKYAQINYTCSMAPAGAITTTATTTTSGASFKQGVASATEGAADGAPEAAVAAGAGTASTAGSAASKSGVVIGASVAAVVVVVVGAAVVAVRWRRARVRHRTQVAPMPYRHG